MILTIQGIKCKFTKHSDIKNPSYFLEIPYRKKELINGRFILKDYTIRGNSLWLQKRENTRDPNTYKNIEDVLKDYVLEDIQDIMINKLHIRTNGNFKTNTKTKWHYL